MLASHAHMALHGPAWHARPGTLGHTWDALAQLSSGQLQLDADPFCRAVAFLCAAGQDLNRKG